MRVKTLTPLALLLEAAFILGQGIPLSTLTRRVTAEDVTPLPGVTVTVESSNLLGRRDASTSPTADYVFNLLPPGDYAVVFALQGMQTVQRRITLAAAGSDRIDHAMRPAPVEESMTVSAPAAQDVTPLETFPVSTNYTQELIDKLPIDRTLRSVEREEAAVRPP